MGKLVDYIARGLAPSRSWTPLGNLPPLYMQSNSHQKRPTQNKPTEEISPHNDAYRMPGRDYLKQ